MFTASELADKETLMTGKFGELKVETKFTRVWFNASTTKGVYEVKQGGKWVLWCEYDPR